MLKLITPLIVLLFCLPFAQLAQSTFTTNAHPLYTTEQKESKVIKIINVDELNSVYHDYCPIVFKDGILFTSNRVKAGETKKGDANFYFSSLTSNGTFETPELYSEKLNSNFQEGMATLSPDGKTLIFSRVVKAVKKAKGFSDVRLYSAKWKDGQWANVKKMSINMKDYSSGHPAFSPDGKQLYFVSNRPGSLGKTDVYVSNLKNGKWSRPKNLGTKVNSSRSEVFPYMDKEGVLYFSSNRRGGNGLLDIYVTSHQENGKWSRPSNMGVPFNSPKNDFGFFMNKGGDSGYLSSNREGGKGGNDIYMWGDNLPIEETMKSTKVSILEKLTGQPIGNAKVSMKDVYENLTEWYSNGKGEIIIDGSISELNLLTIEHDDYATILFDPSVIDKEANTFSVKLTKKPCIKVVGQLVNEKGEPVLLSSVKVASVSLSSLDKSEVLTNQDGTFELCLRCESDYSLKAFPKDYYLVEESFTTKNLTCTSDEVIRLKMAVTKIQEEDAPEKNPNLSGVSPSMTADEIAIRDEKNKTMLESISIPEGDVEEEEEFEVEDIALEEEVEMEVEEKLEEEVAKAKNDFSTIPNIYYDFNSYKIKETDKKYLEDLAVYLKNNPSLNLSINSFTDPKGRKAYNKWLSKRRAQAVMEHLVLKGVEETRLLAVGKGEYDSNLENPVIDDAERRRTEFAIVDGINKDEIVVSNEDGSIPFEENKVYVSNIYYGFNEHRLNEISSLEVDKLILRLNQNPNLKVEIRSHTDSRGSSEYNQWLSQKRANQVVRYIKMQGVDSNRLIGKGFGESELINECSDDVRCSKAEHLENRRTEFVFLED